jgi:5-methylcytosine-specific restriction endonuclease McrA
MDIQESIKRAIHDYPTKEHMHENPSCEIIEHLLFVTGLNMNQLEAEMQNILSAYYATHYKEYLETPHWKKLRALALKEANYQCALCPSTKSLEAHHKIYAHLGQETLKDIVVLCSLCHSIHHDKVIS